MGRVYRVSFTNVSVSAAQDLITIPGATSKVLRILRTGLGCTNTSLAAGQMLSLRARYLPATVTLGTGGTGSITPSKNEPSDAICSVTTARTNDFTTQATTSGTAVVLGVWGSHLWQTFDYVWKTSPVIIPSTAFVFELLGAPTGSVNLSAFVEFEEIG